MHTPSHSASSQPPALPLCVDLDGTLLQTDTAQERVLAFLKHRWWNAWRLPLWLLQGRAHAKLQLAARTTLAAELLPLSTEFLAFLRKERAAGRRLILATGADQTIAQQVSAHLGIFDEVFSTDGKVNLISAQKQRRLVERFGEKGFDYAGNSMADLPIWRSAREAILVNASPSVERRARSEANVTRVFGEKPSGVAVWMRALRVRQWPKNLLLLAPVISAHELTNPVILGKVSLGMAAFCLSDSSVYLVNDLHDLEADRQHPRKRLRPFASGQMRVAAGIALAPVLLALAVVWGVQLPRSFLVYLAVHYVTSMLHSWGLKKVALLDVFLLAGLYTSRLLAGHGATGIAYSSWLLGFSMFLFLSLALLKRYVELSPLQSANDQAVTGVGYDAGGLARVLALGAASGFMSVLVLALYTTSEEARRLYQQPMLLLLICPVLLYWVARVWLLATRQQVDDEPVLFALKDRVSYAVAGLALGTIWLASGR